MKCVCFIWTVNSGLCVSVEFAASCLYAGLSLGFVGGLLFERVGPIWSCLTGLFTSTSGFLLLWYANRHTDYYSRHPDLMAFYYFLAGNNIHFLR